jgi:hypothetical protein
MKDPLDHFWTFRFYVESSQTIQLRAIALHDHINFQFDRLGSKYSIGTAYLIETPIRINLNI